MLYVWLIGMAPTLLVVFGFYAYRYHQGQDTWLGRVVGTVFWTVAWPLLPVIFILSMLVSIGKALALVGGK